jgi:TusA-related sulfurtransferase
MGDEMRMDMTKPSDFTDLTCTNLMIKLKILLKKLAAGEELIFFATREQVDNTCSQFVSQGYGVKWEQSADNSYLVTMKK